MIKQVVIFAGGKGTRLGIDNAKCLVEVAGEPIINYIIREFSNQGVDKFHFCLGFYADEVVKHLNALNINFTWTLDPEEGCGTWKALKSASNYLDDTFFVTYGDSVAFCDLELMYWQFIESEKKYMISVSNYLSEQSNIMVLDIITKLDSYKFNLAKKFKPNFVEHGVTIFSQKALKEDRENIFNFSDYFKNNIFHNVHYANANYYQINTQSDLEYVNNVFKKFKAENVYNFLDRDGTINKWDKNIYQHMKFNPINELLDLLDYSDCVIITNQPDKAKNTATLQNINKMTFYARQFLIRNGKNVIFSMSCIHRDVPNENNEYDKLRYSCCCRKPEIGMLEKANKRIEISKNSLFYGDSDCDEDCAKNFGLKFIKMYN